MTATYRFTFQSTQPAATTALAVTTVVLALFALAFLESSMRALRQARDRVTASIGVPVSAAILAPAGITCAWILTGRQPAAETLLGVGAIGRRSRNRCRNRSHARRPRLPQPTCVQGTVLAGDLGPKASGYRISNVCASPFVAEANSKAIV